jgi:hypothetical protein
MKKITSMRDALADPALLGNVLPGPTWFTWRTLLIAIAGEPLLRTPILKNERRLFKKLAGGRAEPGKLVKTFVAVVGRRGGKTRASSVLAAYLAAFCDYSEVLSPGERGVVLFLALNQQQAQISFRHAAAIFDSVPLLRELIVSRTANTLSLSNGVEVRAASAAGLRGITTVALIADEAAHWRTDEGSVNSDVEVLSAVRPSLLTTGGPMIVISSPYGESGVLFEAYRDHYGKDGGDVLVVHGTSRDFNSNLPQAEIDAELKRDPARASSEYLAQFRAPEAGFVTAKVLDACIVPGRHELPPQGEAYTGFIDVSGGARDSHACAIAFRDPLDGVVTLACAREIKSSNTESVVSEFATLLRSYGLSTVFSDRYGSAWVTDAFARYGIRLQYSPKTRSELYLETLPLLGTGQVRLLDIPKLRTQFLSLRRRITRGGRDDVDHPANGFDELANAVAGCCVMASGVTGGKIHWSVATSGGVSFSTSTGQRNVRYPCLDDVQSPFGSVVYDGGPNRSYDWMARNHRMPSNADYLKDGGLSKPPTQGN